MTSMIKAITKEEVNQDFKNRVFPDFVIQAFNECISESKIKKSDTVLQKDVVAKIKSLTKDNELKITSKMIFDNHWLDVEEFYKKAGWDVSFYSYGYNETGNDYFTFR